MPPVSPVVPPAPPAPAAPVVVGLAPAHGVPAHIARHALSCWKAKLSLQPAPVGSERQLAHETSEPQTVASVQQVSSMHAAHAARGSVRPHLGAGPALPAAPVPTAPAAPVPPTTPPEPPTPVAMKAAQLGPGPGATGAGSAWVPPQLCRLAHAV